MIKAIRGAITVENNTKEDIASSTKELLKKIIEINKLKVDEIISIFFTATNDLDAVFPAAAARELGLDTIPLMCASEIPVKGSLAKCIRVLLHIEYSENKEKIEHVYLKGARSLRPDLQKGEES